MKVTFRGDENKYLDDLFQTALAEKEESYEKHKKTKISVCFNSFNTIVSFIFSIMLTIVAEAVLQIIVEDKRLSDLEIVLVFIGIYVVCYIAMGIIWYLGEKEIDTLACDDYLEVAGLTRDAYFERIQDAQFDDSDMSILKKHKLFKKFKSISNVKILDNYIKSNGSLVVIYEDADGYVNRKSFKKIKRKRKCDIDDEELIFDNGVLTYVEKYKGKATGGVENE